MVPSPNLRKPTGRITRTGRGGSRGREGLGTGPETSKPYVFHYNAPPADLTQGGANLAQLSMTAQFYRQDAVTAANLTHVGLTWHKHAQHCSDSKKDITSGRRAKRDARL